MLLVLTVLSQPSTSVTTKSRLLDVLMWKCYPFLLRKWPDRSVHKIANDVNHQGSRYIGGLQHDELDNELGHGYIIDPVSIQSADVNSMSFQISNNADI